MTKGRESGIEAIGDVPWSTHFGLFYRTKQDLIDILVPYFKAGLENNEFCMWVTAEPLDVGEARLQMARAMPDFDSYVEKGQIEIIPHTEWYTIGGVFDADRVLNGWVDKLREAERRGFSGLRLTGNESWLDRSTWQDFIDYEQTVNDVVGRYKMIIVCSYPQDKCDASDVLDVAGTHQFVLSKRNGRWRLIEDQEQKKAKKALRSSEQFLNNVFDSIQDGLTVLDRDLNIIQRNHVIEAWYSYKMPLIGKKCYDAFHERASPCEVCPSMRAIKLGVAQSDIVPFHGEYSKQRGWLEIFAFPLKDDEGNVTGVIEQVRDITGRKRAEGALRETEEMFRALADISDAAIMMHQGQNFVYANDAAGRITGYTKDELLSMPFWRIIHPDMREGVKERGLARLRGEMPPKNYEMKLITKNGETKWALFSAAPFKQQGRPAIIFTLIEITERKQAEEALKLTQFALDNFRDSAIWLTLDGCIVYVNQEACKSLGYSREELLSMHLWDIDPGYPLESLMELWPEKRQGRYSKFESTHVARDGRAFPVEVTSCYTRYGDKEYLIAFDRDITERKRAEKELEEVKNNAELYLDLMGHDINNMNQVGMGFLELALQSPDIQKQDKELLLKSLGSLESSSRLIENVRKVQKVRSRELMYHEVDACRMISRALAHYSNLPDIKASFNYELPPCGPVIANDLLYEVFENLIGNAIKHGGQEPIIDVKFMAATLDGKKYNKFTVEDNGPGIPDGMKERIFNRRQRGDTNAKGSGLGLYLVKSLVESYGGRVWAEDRVFGDHTQGAKFVVMLPAIETQ